MSASPFEMPSSVPAGMRLELSRAKLLPNMEDEFSEWMKFLHENYSEIQDGLGVEQELIESTFIHTDLDGTRWIYHFSLLGENSPGLDTNLPLSAKHQEFAKMCKEKGWEELEPVIFISSKEVTRSLTNWLRKQTESDQ